MEKSHKIMLCLASAGTQVTLVDDDVNNGTNGFSVSKMRVSKLYFRRTNSDPNLLKCINIQINNIGNVDGGDLNTCYFYDGINVPSSRFFCNIISENQSDSIISYYNEGSKWDYINKYGQYDNMKTIEILVYQEGTTLLNEITQDNRLYIELEFS